MLPKSGADGKEQGKQRLALPGHAAAFGKLNGCHGCLLDGLMSMVFARPKRSTVLGPVGSYEEERSGAGTAERLNRSGASWRLPSMDR
jgi:hypothetical protein